MHDLLADYAPVAKSSLTGLHMLGLALGLGAATLLDLVILRFLVRGKISLDHFNLIHFATRIVTAGLVMLWISGACFLLHYALFDPAKLANGKIYAKIAIVLILTLNGVLIHRSILPAIRARVGRSLLDGMPPLQRLAVLSAGAISGVSWYVPLALGAIPQFNFLPITTILLVFALVLASVIIATYVLSALFLPREEMVTLTLAEYRKMQDTLEQRDRLIQRCIVVLRQRTNDIGTSRSASPHSLPSVAAVPQETAKAA